MSMEITNSYSGYEKSCTNVPKEDNVVTNTVELKTSKPGVTKTEQIKTGYSNVNDYSKYLQSRYSYMNTGTTSMQGVPTTVSVSGAFLKKCMNDPEKAKYLEENLAALPDCASYAVSHAQGTLTNISYEIDADGNITGILSGTNDPDGKIARENAQRKAKEKKAEEEKAVQRRKEKKAEEEKAVRRQKEKKAEEEKAAAKQAEKEEQSKKLMKDAFTVSASGTDMRSITQNIITAVSEPSLPGGSFDIKA